MSRYNRVRLRVNVSSHRIINKLYYSNISLYDIDINDDDIAFSVDVKDRAKVINLLNDFSVDYSIVNESMIMNILTYTRTKVGIVIGVVISTILAILLSYMTLDIEIVGNEITSTSCIEETLRDSGIKLYGFKSNNLRDIEDSLIASNESIAYASVRYEGTKLVVSVKEELPKPKYSTSSDGSIIANYDGIITRLIVASGTALVKVGDTVKQGDVLIEPFRHYGDGNEERIIPVTARGEVYATTYIGEDINIPNEYEIYNYTGKTKSITSLTSKVPKSPYEYYDVTQENVRLYGALPISYTRYTFYEKSKKTISLNDELHKNALINDAKDRLNVDIIDGDRVMREWIFEKRLDNLYIISVYYEVEKLISGGRLEQV